MTFPESPHSLLLWIAAGLALACLIEDHLYGSAKARRLFYALAYALIFAAFLTLLCILTL